MLLGQKWVFHPIFSCPLYGHAAKTTGYLVVCTLSLKQWGALTPKKETLVHTNVTQNLSSLTCSSFSNLSAVLDSLSTAKASCTGEARTEYRIPGRISHILNRRQDPFHDIPSCTLTKVAQEVVG